jgi:hypothetical protein
MTKNKLIGWGLLSIPFWIFLGVAIITNSVMPFLTAMTIVGGGTIAIWTGMYFLFKD